MKVKYAMSFKRLHFDDLVKSFTLNHNLCLLWYMYQKKVSFQSKLPNEKLCRYQLVYWRRRWRCENFTTFPTTTKTDCGQILIRNLKLKLSFRVTWANTYNRHMRFCLHMHSISNIVGKKTLCFREVINIWNRFGIAHSLGMDYKSDLVLYVVFHTFCIERYVTYSLL